MKHTDNKRKSVLRLMLIFPTLLLGSILILLFPGLLSSLLSLGLSIAALEPVEQFALLGFFTLSLIVLNRHRIVTMLTEVHMECLPRRQAGIDRVNAGPRNLECIDCRPFGRASPKAGVNAAPKAFPPLARLAFGGGALHNQSKVWRESQVDWKPFECKMTCNAFNAQWKPISQESQTIQAERQRSPDLIGKDASLMEHKIWQD